MRLCPICKSFNHKIMMSKYDKWYKLWQCDDCQSFYVDSDHGSQRYFNRKYADVHAFSELIGDSDTLARLSKLADYIAKYPKHWKIADLGGADGQLKTILNDLGYKNVETFGAGESLDDIYNLIVCSHTLEHVYDTHGFMDSIREHTSKVIIEVPLWLEGADYIKYDKYCSHLNKFNVMNLMQLLTLHGFKTTSIIILPDIKVFHSFRVEAQ